MFKLFVFAVAACVPLSVAAGDAEAMKRLKETQVCVGCDLSGSDLRWAAVYEAELGGAPNLVNGDLSGADLSGANLYGANLQGTRFVGAKLAGATLSWSDMSNANLTDADLADARLDGVIFCGTTMPDGTRNDANC